MNTFAASNFDSGRTPRPPVTSRPVQWPNTSVMRIGHGLDHPPGHRRASMDSLECTLATTTSSRSSSSVLLIERAVIEDVDLDAGQDAHRRERLADLVDDVELLAQPLGGEPVGDPQARRVVGQRTVFVAQFLRREHHLLDREPNRRTSSSARADRRAGRRGCRRHRDPLHADRNSASTSGSRPAHAWAMTFAVLGPTPGSDCQLLAAPCRSRSASVERLDDVGGVAVGHHAAGVLTRPVLVIRNLAQCGDRIHGFSVPPTARFEMLPVTWCCGGRSRKIHASRAAGTLPAPYGAHRAGFDSSRKSNRCLNGSVTRM